MLRLGFVNKSLVSEMLVFPQAKINIGLNITGKRSDGFHNIETILYPIGLSDILETVIDPERSRSGIELVVTGLNGAGDKRENLVVRAYELLLQNFPLPFVRSHLHKIIPIGAGLGGGSSDGANMLKLLNKMFQLGISEEMLKEYALELGSDCPFFISPKPVLATGRGEIMKDIDIPLKGYQVVVLFPDVGVSTSEAYQHTNIVDAKIPLSQIVLQKVDKWRQEVVNGFETYTISVFPIIQDLITQLYEAGALYASMSGSGSAVYGLFSQEVELYDSLSNYMVWRGIT